MSDRIASASWSEIGVIAALAVALIAFLWIVIPGLAGLTQGAFK